MHEHIVERVNDNNTYTYLPTYTIMHKEYKCSILT